MLTVVCSTTGVVGTDPQLHVATFSQETGDPAAVKVSRFRLATEDAAIAAAWVEGTRYTFPALEPIG